MSNVAPMPAPPRPATPTDLAALDFGGAQWAGWFAPARRDYSAWVDHEVQHLTLGARAANPEATIQIAGQSLGHEGNASLALAVGLNRFTMTISAPGAGDRAIEFYIQRRHPTANWDLVAEKRPFPARDSAGELVFDGFLWLFGGYIPKVINDLWRSRDGVTWEQMPDVPATGGINIPLRWVHDGRMWITSQAGELLASRDGRTWDLVTKNAPWVGRKNCGSVAFQGRMWVIGGSSSVFHNDVWSSADGIHWTCELEHAPWCPRHLWDNVVVHRGRIFVLGGGVQRYHPSKSHRDVWSSADGRNWDLVCDQAPWLGRQWGSCVSYRDRLWVLGGYRSEPSWTNLNDVWHSPDGSRWQQLETTRIWSPRHEISPYVHDGKLWVVAGNAWPLMNDVWSLSLPGLCFLTQPVVQDFAGQMYRYDARADFQRGDEAARYRLTQAPSWLSVDAATGVVRGIIPDGAQGEFTVTLEAAAARETATQTWTVRVL
jgi:hypothetical protein